MKEEEIERDAYTVLLPAFTQMHLSEAAKHYLKKGGCSILLAETREEYVNREMSAHRKSNETNSSIINIVNKAKAIQENLIVAVDQEFRGICRLHNLVPNFPEDEKPSLIQTEDFESICNRIALEAKHLGVNCFLAPILDVITGENPWLQGRTWTQDLEEVGRLSSAFVTGTQKANVISTAKHFPGFSNIKLDPAIHSNSVMDDSIESVKKNLQPFKKVSQHGVEIIMVGPAIVEAIDKENPASVSQKVISILRDEIKFSGIVLSDDLDAKATMKEYQIEEVAVKAIQAGCDFLLLADVGDQIIRVANALKNAVINGDISGGQLRISAERIRNLAVKYN